MTKAVITKIGTVTPEGMITGWGFDCLGDAPIILFTEDSIVFCGYTFEELREIAEKQ